MSQRERQRIKFFGTSCNSQFYDRHCAPLHNGWVRGRKPGNRRGRRGVIRCGDCQWLQGYHAEIHKEATFFHYFLTRTAPHTHQRDEERKGDEEHELALLHKLATPRGVHAPFLYSGSPVMSSRPSNFHPNIFSIGSIRLYVVQPVSLWNGTSSSPSAAALLFSASHGHTSPRGTPPSVVRSVGHIGVRPEMRTCQRTARGT